MIQIHINQTHTHTYTQTQWVTKNKGSTAAEKLYDLLNQRHFVEGKKLNDPDMLADAAHHAAGVDIQVCMHFQTTVAICSGLKK
jgi:predicted DsbA family dithiol-disulfide isomerase